MTKCTKRMYATQDLAATAGHSTHRAQLDVRAMHTYQCKTCRFPGGKKAWHWGHRQSWGHRKQW